MDTKVFKSNVQEAISNSTFPSTELMEPPSGPIIFVLATPIAVPAGVGSGVEKWKSGKVERWKSGKVERWKGGKVERWKKFNRN